MHSRSLRNAVRVAGLVGIVWLSGWTDLVAQQIHRNGFAGKQTGWLRGEDTVRGVEKSHQLTEQYAHSLPTSEQISIEAPAAPTDPALLHYYYSTAPAPISEELSASVWVKASRAGIVLKARLVLPKERDPNKPEEPLTTILVGDRYQLPGRWQRLELARPTKLVREHQQALRVQLGRDVDFTDAFIDRLILNLYTGPGTLDAFVDDLEIGPVRPNPLPPAANVLPMATPTGQNPPAPLMSPRAVKRNDRGVAVELSNERLLVGGKPFFFRAIRHTDTPLKTLRDAGFNTVWFDTTTPGESIEEAISHGFWIVPSLPLLADERTADNGVANGQLASRTEDPSKTTLTTARTPEGLATAISRFLSGDSVLFWDLGGGRSAEQASQVARTAAAIRSADPQRPRGADIWDGFSNYSQSLELIGTHRWPLMSSLELTKYRDWLTQRRNLATPGSFMWTWIQTHIPEQQARLLYDHGTAQGFQEPVGPQPEQIRLLTYLALASGCKGIGYWSDRFLADSHQGRDRLLALALLNQEITMLEPLLLSLNEQPTWLETNNANVKAAVLRSNKGILVLPIWMGEGSQYVPGQGAMQNLEIIVPQIPNGAQPWEISPGHVRSLQFGSERQLGGVKVTIPEFDLTAAIVFTNDLSPTGLVVQWQNHSRRVSKLAAQWAIDLAAIQLEKVSAIHSQLEPLAPVVTDAAQLLADAERRLLEAKRAERDGLDRDAYLNAMRSMRPLRILMRTHWDNAAIATRGNITASPYAVSFYTLPKHWQFQGEVNRLAQGGNMLRGGDFEVPSLRDPVTQVSGTTAISIASLPGWTVEKGTLDPVDMDVAVVATTPLKSLKAPEVPVKKLPFDPSRPNRLPDPKTAIREPEIGNGCLRIRVLPKNLALGKKAPPIPRALERTYIAATTPWVKLPPGSLVKISGWAYVTAEILGSADGAVIFDSVGGEAFGMRGIVPGKWTQFVFYRRVPEHGQVSLTCMLTGMGIVFLDDMRIEPLTAEASVAPAVPAPMNTPNP